MIMFTSISPVYLFFAGDLLYESVEFKLRNLLVVFTTLASHFSLFKCSSLLCSGELKQLELVLCLCNFTYTLHTEKNGIKQFFVLVFTRFFLYTKISFKTRDTFRSISS